MDLGTAIFLSSIVLAVVILYGINKAVGRKALASLPAAPIRRWSWRRAAFVFFGLIVPGVGAYYWQQLPQKIERQTAYAGLRLGMSQDEVMYTKGYPPFVLGEEVTDPQWKGSMPVVDTKNLEKGKRAIDYRDWYYEEDQRNINVTFNRARTAVTEIQCYSEDKVYRCPELGGVRDGDSEKEVLRKLGNPTTSKIDGVTKQMSYGDLNIEIWLTKEVVYMLALRDPSHQR
jgi:hypothetical protein